jgi:hypothetical protein
MTTHQPPDPTPIVNLVAEKPRCPAPTADGSCRWPLSAGPCPWHLDAGSGLSESEIRARALDVASYVIGDVSGTVNGIANHLIDLAEPLVDWIRDGFRPGDGGEDDRDRRR